MLIASCLPIAGYFFSGTEKIRKMIHVWGCLNLYWPIAQQNGWVSGILALEE